MNEAVTATGHTQGGSRPEGPTPCPHSERRRPVYPGRSSGAMLTGPVPARLPRGPFAAGCPAAQHRLPTGAVAALRPSPSGSRWPPPLPAPPPPPRPRPSARQCVPERGPSIRGAFGGRSRSLSPGAAAGGGRRRGRAERRRAGPAQRGASRRGGGARRGGGGAGRSQHGAASGAPVARTPHTAREGASTMCRPALARLLLLQLLLLKLHLGKGGSGAVRRLSLSAGAAAAWGKCAPRLGAAGEGGRVSCLPGHPGVCGRGHPLAAVPGHARGVATCGGPGTLFSGRMQPDRWWQELPPLIPFWGDLCLIRAALYRVCKADFLRPTTPPPPPSTLVGSVPFSRDGAGACYPPPPPPRILGYLCVLPR